MTEQEMWIYSAIAAWAITLSAVIFLDKDLLGRWFK